MGQTVRSVLAPGFPVRFYLALSNAGAFSSDKAFSRVATPDPDPRSGRPLPPDVAYDIIICN